MVVRVIISVCARLGIVVSAIVYEYVDPPIVRMRIISGSDVCR
jgi:hypothetical protein